MSRGHGRSTQARYPIAHYYLFGTHKPGSTNVWRGYEATRSAMPHVASAIGTPAEVRDYLNRFYEAGVDQVVFIQQSGRNRHRHICESLELFAREVMPEFKEKGRERSRRKMEELAPYLEEAAKRKHNVLPPADADIPDHRAYGRSIIKSVADVYKA